MLHFKKCGKCATEKTINNFHNNISRYDGKSGWCKSCLKPLLLKNKKEKKELKRIKNNTEWVNLDGEIWKDIDNYDSSYQVSNKGRIRSNLSTGLKLISSPINRISGYKYVTLKKNNKAKTYYLHRLVAKAFVENPNNFNIVNHIDGDKSNVSLENLEWVSKIENTKHAIQILGRHKMLYIRSCGNYCRTETDAIYAKARKITKDTGVQHHVDHIIPLNGENICGLHVPWNLKIVTSAENFSKNNKLHFID